MPSTWWSPSGATPRNGWITLVRGLGGQALAPPPRIADFWGSTLKLFDIDTDTDVLSVSIGSMQILENDGMGAFTRGDLIGLQGLGDSMVITDADRDGLLDPVMSGSDGVDPVIRIPRRRCP